MKLPLSEIEQDNLRTRGVLGNSEIAYINQQDGLTYAENVLSGFKRIINSSSRVVNEGKNLLLG